MYGRVSLIAKATILKIVSNRIKAVCGLESHFFLKFIHQIFIVMIIDLVLADVILDWTFLNPLNDNDDGKTIFEEKQVLVQAEVSPEVYY